MFRFSVLALLAFNSFFYELRAFADRGRGYVPRRYGFSLPVNLPEEEQIERILRSTFVADCDDALARMYGLNCAAELIGKRMSDMVAPDDPKNVELTRQFIRSGYQVLQKESHEVDIRGNPKVFLNSMSGVVVEGKLIATWGRQRDITNRFRRRSPAMNGGLDPSP